MKGRSSSQVLFALAFSCHHRIERAFRNLHLQGGDIDAISQRRRAAGSYGLALRNGEIEGHAARTDRPAYQR